MKKSILILSALAALALAGCTKVETFSSRESSCNEIGFATYTGRAVTKAGTALGQSFNVESFLSGTPASRYFHSTSYRFASNRYTGDTTRFWPVTGNLDFYAVSPLQYMNTSGTAVDLKPVDSTFTVTKTDGKTDIVAARLVNVLNGTDPVTLEFGHKLTKVSFKAVGFDATKNYKISSITVVANSTGEYSYGADSWTDSTDTHEYTFLDECRSIPVSTTTPVALGDTLFLIPSQAATIKAQIRYSIYDGAIKIDTTVAPVEVNLPVSGVWGINKSVVYKLTLNISSTRNPINFSATVEDWDADTSLFAPPFYIDKGVNYGPGITIGDVVWAPVNCGTDSNYPYGLLYQWGRKYGQAYELGEMPLVAMTMEEGQMEENADNYALTNKQTFNWFLGPVDNTLWNGSTKGLYDPCPEGWRVPTNDELGYLFFADYNPEDEYYCPTDIKGEWNSTLKGWVFDSGLFLPAAGIRQHGHGQVENRGALGKYWSSTAGRESADYMGFANGGALPDGGDRGDAYSVRCVAEY